METEIAKMGDEEVMEIVRQLLVAYKLKKTLRYATKRDMSVHSESVAEHKFALLFLCEYFLPLEDPHQGLDGAKVRRIILFHDFPEIPYGDIPYYQKTPAHEAREKEAAIEVFASLPVMMRGFALASWQEYEGKKSPEARFAYALDKIEPLFEQLDPVNELSMKR